MSLPQSTVVVLVLPSGMESLPSADSAGQHRPSGDLAATVLCAWVDSGFAPLFQRLSLFWYVLLFPAGEQLDSAMPEP